MMAVPKRPETVTPDGTISILILGTFPTDTGECVMTGHSLATHLVWPKCNSSGMVKTRVAAADTRPKLNSTSASTCPA